MNNTPNDFNDNGSNTESPQNTGSYTGGYGNNYGGYGYGAPQYQQPAVPPEKKGVPVYVTVILLLITAVVTFQVTSLWYQFGVLGGKNNGAPSYFDTALTIDEYLREYYIGEMDEELISQALAAALLYASGDAYAYYFTPEEYADESMSYQGNAVGIGILVSYRDDGYIEILRVFEGAPAEAAGFKSGDIIMTVAGKDVAELGYDEATAAIQGEPGTTVTVTVKRGDESMELTATRQNYVQQTVDGHMYKDGATSKKVGVVQIYSFNNSTTEQFINEVNALIAQGAEGLVFDVRDNPGGTLDSVVAMLDFLLPEGKIVRITDKNGKEVQSYSSDKECVDLPMAVLTNGNSASAAELFTSALKDYEKAVSVGTKSYGKGTMQIMIPLPDGGAFKFSYRYYSPPFSENYHGVGISPEIEVTIPEGTKIPYLTDETDTQLAAAVEHILNGK